MNKTLRDLNRLQSSFQEAIGAGVKTWTTSQLADSDARFEEVWSLASGIPGWFFEFNAAAIFQVLAELRPQRVVEIGSYMGKSTVFFGSSLQVLGDGGKVTAIDPHSGDRQHRENYGMSEIPSFEMFQTHVRLAGVEGFIEPIVATSSDAVKEWTEPFEFLYVDGWHSYDAVLADGREWVPKLADDGVVVFDDALKYDEVGQAIADLDREGTIHLWGHFFRQAYAGKTPTPPPSVQRVFAAGRLERLARKIDGLLPKPTRRE